MEKLGDISIVSFASQEAWETWLAAHCEQTQGVWMKFAKKGAATPTVTYAEAMDGALCYGWIDGQVKSYDKEYYLQKFTPRRPKSVWSKINVEKVGRLTAAGKMKPSGLAAVEAAKQDGRWEQAYDSPRTMTTPPDFQAALDQDPQAKAFFATLNKSNTYAFLWRIQTARTPKTRQAKIVQLIAMLHDGKQFHT